MSRNDGERVLRSLKLMLEEMLFRDKIKACHKSVCQSKEKDKVPKKEFKAPQIQRIGSLSHVCI